MNYNVGYFQKVKNSGMALTGTGKIVPFSMINMESKNYCYEI